MKVPPILNLLFRSASTMSMMKPKVPSFDMQPTSLTASIKFPMSESAHHKNVIKSSYQGAGFYMEQMLTGCLAIYSYYIESGN